MEFVFHCYGRKIIKDYIDETLDLDLFGNEDKIINDYDSEIRGSLLGYLATVLKMEVTLVHSEGDNKEEGLRESLGNMDAPWKVVIFDED